MNTIPVTTRVGVFLVVLSSLIVWLMILGWIIYSYPTILLNVYLLGFVVFYHYNQSTRQAL